MTGPRMSVQQKLTVLARTNEPDTFVMYCTSASCDYVGDTNAVHDPVCPRCRTRSLSVWKSRT